MKQAQDCLGEHLQQTLGVGYVPSYLVPGPRVIKGWIGNKRGHWGCGLWDGWSAGGRQTKASIVYISRN